MATREKRFLAAFFVAFLGFSVLMNLLSGGTAKFQLMGAAGFSGAMRIIWDALLGVFGVNKIFAEWLPAFALAALQGALIGLITLLWDKKRVRKGKKGAKAEGADPCYENAEKATNNAENVQSAGIVTGLIALGAGCPTCGTTLLSPLIGTIFSTGSLAATGVITGVVTAVAVVVALLSLKRLGLETYVIIVNEKYLAKKANRGAAPDGKKTERKE